MTGAAPPDGGRPGYRDHFQRPEAVVAYQRTYTGPDRTGDQQAWDHQRRWLQAALPPVGDGTGRRALDYACGTGRVLAVLADRYPLAHGWDSSAAMLRVCQAAVPTARLRLVDLADPTAGRPPPGRFDVITVFRLLLNLEPDRRAVILRALVDRLADGGLLVVENHGNRRSLRHLALPLRRRPAGFANELTDRQMRALLADAGLDVLARAGFGWLPERLHRSGRTGLLARRVDGLLQAGTRSPVLAIRVLYLARRSPPREPAGPAPAGPAPAGSAPAGSAPAGPAPGGSAPGGPAPEGSASEGSAPAGAGGRPGRRR
ncbi:MAG: hypothetical protein V7637_1466 [Mycobacteriales bacterium]